MCIPLTPVLHFLYTVIIEVLSLCFTESVSLRDIGKLTLRAEISSPSSLYFKAVKGSHIGSAFCLTTFPVSRKHRAAKEVEQRKLTQFTKFMRVNYSKTVKSQLFQHKAKNMSKTKLGNCQTEFELKYG